ncbi:MAG TPA: YihY/virulence factor BrkB family protein [Terriglobales bacterium]|nr:YihY/virulence factor BrkB family protein [Terriglobales bacterium]
MTVGTALNLDPPAPARRPDNGMKPTRGSFLFKLLKNVRMAVWRAFVHDAFGVAKGGAYSAILTMFPALMVAGAIIATFEHSAEYMREISDAAYQILPQGPSGLVRAFFETAQGKSVSVLITASLITLWTASGVMISWMEGFRNAYQFPKVWGVVKERFIAFGLVIMAGIPLTFATGLVAFGNQIEARINAQLGHELGPYVLIAWIGVRWLIAILTSIAVMQLIYHNAVPRTLSWHTVLPGAALATAIWFPATMAFGWYVRHFAAYSLFYGSLTAAIVLLIWLYIISIIVLIGAEFNALLYPRIVVAGQDTTVLRTPGPK